MSAAVGLLHRRLKWRFLWLVHHLFNWAPERHGRVRLWFSDGGCGIVAFKTSVPASGVPIDQFVAEESQRYRGQLGQYKAVLETLVKEQSERFAGAATPNLPIKTALYFTALNRLEPIN